MAGRMAVAQQQPPPAAYAGMLDPGVGPLPVQAAPPGIALGLGAMSQEQHSGAEFTHLCTAFADCIEALPPSITRSISDLRELDAVLSGSLGTITDKLNTLLALLEQPNSNTVKPEHRLLLLKEIAEEARSFRLGGEDKIRVATGTCETLIHHTNQLDVLAHLLATLLPASMAGTMPPPSWPHGYPVLFPTQASASGSAYRKPDYLPSGIPVPSHGHHHHMPANMHVTAAHTHGRQTALHHQAHPSLFGAHMSANQHGLAGGGSYVPARHAQMHDVAAEQVQRYAREGVPYPDPAYIQSQIQRQKQIDAAALQSGYSSAGGKKQRQSTGAAGGKGRGGRSNAPAMPNHVAYAQGSASGYASPAEAARGRPGYSGDDGFVAPSAHHSMQNGNSRTRDNSPAPGRDEWIPYANQARASQKSNVDDEYAPSGQQHHHHHHHTLAGAHHHHHHHVHRDSSSSTGGAGSSGLKRRRASNRDNDYAVDDAPYAGDLGAPGGLGIGGRERQVSGRNGSTGLPSPTVAHGQVPNKRSRTTSKKAQDSPDPAGAGSPYYAAPAPVSATNGTSRSSAAGQNPRRKASAAEMVDYGVPPLEEDDGLDGDGADEPAEGDEDDQAADGEDTRTYCYCDRVSFGDMIGCDGETCEREWFHLACLGMETPPRGEWFCDECAAKMGKVQQNGGAKKRR